MLIGPDQNKVESMAANTTNLAACLTASPTSMNSTNSVPRARLSPACDDSEAGQVLHREPSLDARIRRNHGNSQDTEPGGQPSVATDFQLSTKSPFDAFVLPKRGFLVSSVHQSRAIPSGRWSFSTEPGNCHDC